MGHPVLNVVVTHLLSFRAQFKDNTGANLPVGVEEQKTAAGKCALWLWIVAVSVCKTAVCYVCTSASLWRPSQMHHAHNRHACRCATHTLTSTSPRVLLLVHPVCSRSIFLRQSLRSRNILDQTSCTYCNQVRGCVRCRSERFQ